MKIIAKFKDILSNQKNDSILSLIVSDWNHKEIIKELDLDKTYSIEIKEVKSKRSLAQNRFLWKLLHEINEKINGRAGDEMETYAMCLERANAKFEYIACLPEIEKSLKQNFRAVKFVKEYDLNGTKGAMFKVYIGSSKMNVKEMNLLIETALDIASEVGLDRNYWNEVLAYEEAK